MATNVTDIDAGSDSRSDAGLAAPLAVLGAALLALMLLAEATGRIARDIPGQVLLWAAVVGALTLGFAWVRPVGLPRYGRVFLTASAVFLALYFAIEPFAIPYAALGPEHIASRFHAQARWIGVALALIGLFRPSFVFGAAMLLWLVRELHTTLTGFYFSTLDIRNVAEVIAFVAVGLTLVAAVRARRRVANALGLDDAGAARAVLIIVAAGIGAHLGNYFLSALAKLALDGGVLSWVLDNRLADGIPAALEKGTLPSSFSPPLTQFLYTAMVALSVPMNIAALALQFAAPWAARSRRDLIRLTIGFDLFHIVVYLALGLLFWKWIALNLIIVATLLAMDEGRWDRLAATTCIVFTLAGALVFRTASLAWYDAPGFASPFFEAVLTDGSRVRLPSAFFQSSSYQVSQGRLWWPGGTAHFNSSIWGSVLKYRDLVAGRTCRVPARAAPARPEWGPPRALGRFIAAHHRDLVAHADATGHVAWVWLPHHHVPSPGVTDPVLALDTRRIATYVYVMESVCLGIDKGLLTRRVIARTALPVYDARTDRVLP